MVGLQTTKIFEQVCRELDALKRSGVKVPRMAYTVAASEADGFHNSGMSVAEVAGFCISLAGVKTTKGRLARVAPLYWQRG